MAARTGPIRRRRWPNSGSRRHAPVDLLRGMISGVDRHVLTELAEKLKAEVAELERGDGYV